MWEDNIKVNIEGMGYDGADVDLGQFPVIESCEQISDNFGFHKRKWFVFRSGEFLMASKEVCVVCS